MAQQKIRDKNARKVEIKRPSAPLISNIAFSFKHLTNNKQHCFSYFRNEMRNSHAAYEALVKRMQELCNIDMNGAKQMGKISGCEPMPYKELSETIQKICDGTGIISKDSSLSVFRFNQNNYRMLCKTDINHSNLLYIIAFDFDFSAYDHG